MVRDVQNTSAMQLTPCDLLYEFEEWSYTPLYWPEIFAWNATQACLLTTVGDKAYTKGVLDGAGQVSNAELDAYTRGFEKGEEAARLKLWGQGLVQPECV